MAQIDICNFKRTEKERNTVHEKVHGSYSVFELKGEKYFQLDTFGRSDEQVLNAIFNELRDKQSGKKNSDVEGITIQTTDEVINYCRHLTSNEIRLFVLQRIINRNPLEKGVCPSFIPIYNMWPPESQKDKLDECQQALCRALFNNNFAKEFWELFENVYNTIVEHPQYDVQHIYLSIDDEVKKASPDFDVLSLKYFIAVIKDGIQYEN